MKVKKYKIEFCDTIPKKINEGILYIAKRAINYSIEKESLIHPDTIYLINSIIQIVDIEQSVQ